MSVQYRNISCVRVPSRRVKFFARLGAVGVRTRSMLAAVSAV